MTLFHKVAAAVAIGSFATMIVLAAVGNFLDSHHLVRDREAAGVVAKCVAFALFLLLGFSLVPLALHLFVVAQATIGNAEIAPIRFLREHERGVTFAVWSFFAAGILIASPVIWTQLFGFSTPLPRNQGTITASVGMTLAEAAARSTFKISPGMRQSLTGSSTSVSEGIFDFKIAGAGIRFEKCRYCWLETGNHDDPQIAHINVGISTRKMPRDKLVAEMDDITRRLRTAGWLSGHYEYTEPEIIRLHGGATREGDGRYWAKAGALLVLSEKRMDDEQPGDDARSGEFIHVIDVLPRNDPLYRKLIFDSPNPVKTPQRVNTNGSK